ncbi:hypothetical protein [Albirhodobacter sp. R86504]|jgi:hypothetical protein|uniref:hypothetical protein n=1 Tax=Albirhodobacter sp. R86504 TaxID=3093848 RepID=UPI00366F010F
MDILIWIGAVISVIGVIGIAACVMIVLRAKRAGLDETAFKARMQRAVAVNIGALMISMLGLMMVVVGIVLG